MVKVESIVPKWVVWMVYKSISTPALTTAGIYVFTATLDGVTETCEYTLPFVEENGEYGSCDGENLWLTISGTALDESEHSIPEMYIPSSPTDVSLRLPEMK